MQVSKSLFMGNDSGLNISHSGTLLINDLSLSNVLCVPSMKQQIISISQLNKKPNSAVLFLPHYFYVMDLKTGQTTHKGCHILFFKISLNINRVKFAIYLNNFLR